MLVEAAFACSHFPPSLAGEDCSGEGTVFRLEALQGGGNQPLADL